MNERFERSLVARKIAQCAQNDAYIKYMLDKKHEEGFEYYSDTSKVMKELFDKYHFTPEEVIRSQRCYDTDMTLELVKLYNK